MIPDLLAGFRIVIPVDGYLGGAAVSRQTKMLGYLVLVESHRQVAAFLHLKHLSQAAAMRRLIRPADAPPLGRIRSLAYFLRVIEEVLELHVSPDYFDYLRCKLARTGSTR